jgi:hypothetical protein
MKINTRRSECQTLLLKNATLQQKADTLNNLALLPKVSNHPKKYAN